MEYCPPADGRYLLRYHIRGAVAKDRGAFLVNGLLLVEHVAVWKCLPEPLLSGFTYHRALYPHTLKLLQLSQVNNTLIGNRGMPQSKLPKFGRAAD